MAEGLGTRTNELIRKIAQTCGRCKFGQGKGVGLQCTKKGPCYSKNVKRWLKELQELETKEVKT